MRSLTATELLMVWEQGFQATTVERGLLLLGAACPEESPDDLAQLPIGQRDSRLLTLRARQFGEQLACVVPCPNCHEQLELSFATSDIQALQPARKNKTLRLRRQGYDVRFRLPNSLDLLALPQTTDGQTAFFLDRCILTAKHKGEAVSVTELPDQIVAAVIERMTQADQQAEVQLPLTCPACGYEWRAIFDIMSFFWTEINTWALHLLHEVHQLAIVYGWSEADILALSPWRRQLYLQMIGSL